MRFLNRRQIQNQQPKPKPREKTCRRVIKRDEEGRIREERFVGCTPQEIKMMKESVLED